MRLLAGLVAYVADRLLHVNALTERFGGANPFASACHVMRPSAGKIMLAGHDITRLSSEAAAKLFATFDAIGVPLAKAA